MPICNRADQLISKTSSRSRLDRLWHDMSNNIGWTTEACELEMTQLDYGGYTNESQTSYAQVLALSGQCVRNSNFLLLDHMLVFNTKRCAGHIDAIR